MYEHPWEPLGHALLDYFNGDNEATMNVVSDFEIPVMMSAELFFRNPEWFPMLEQTALRQCSGRVLDIGAGAGSHALTLQELGAPVTAIDVSKKAVQVMKGRGIKDARCTDFLQD
jgi:2-polyprenyl-3-methyl-5-hydroxy-6-metoxy-1,4-benzoquinol methylase